MSVVKLHRSPTLCPKCNNPAKKNGSFIRQRNRVKVQRYKCQSCPNTFSSHTTKVTYKQHRPDLNEKIMALLCNGVGIRRIAQALSTTPKTVQNKIKFLSYVCDSFHNNHFKNWKIKPRFQFDEMWSIQSSRISTLTVPTVVEKESYFIVAVRSAHTHSLSRDPFEKGMNNTKRKHLINSRDAEIMRTLNKCNEMKPHGRIIMETDKKIDYQKILKKVFGKRLVHAAYNSKIKKEAIKLFPVNNTMACFRAEIAKCRRESWYQTKDYRWYNAHLAIYLVYYNYIRKKKYTVRDKGLVLVVNKCQAVRPPKKTYKWETPAMRLGIFDEPLTFRFILENFEKEYLSTKSTPLTPVSNQIPFKKSA
jgi:transposase-like protein